MLAIAWALMAATTPPAAAAAAAPAAAQTDVGDRRGRIGARIGDRTNDRAAARTADHWTDPVARERSTRRPVARNASDAITYGRDYPPR